MKMSVTMLFAVADMARYQDVIKWFYSEPVVRDVTLDTDFSHRPCTSALEQHNGSADEPTTDTVSSQPVPTD